MAKINQPQIIVIVGPTASGKSDLGIKLAEKYYGEIISADSRQVYHGMNIGTGKVKKDRITGLSKKNYYSEGIRHHLIDIANPKKQFTASDFKRLGEKAIKEVTAGGKIPIIVGGTGFYIDILIGRMNVAEVPPDKKLRAELEKQSAEQLFKRFSSLDPQYSKIIDRHNKRRLIRALEIVLTTGKPISSAVVSSKYPVLWLGLRPKNLDKRIGDRLDKRLAQGMIKEVKKLHKEEVSWKRLDDFGLEYRWISRWIIKNAKIKMENDNVKFKKSEEYNYLLRDILRYSKRQMTWFKRNKEIHWIKNLKEAKKITSTFLPEVIH